MRTVPKWPKSLGRLEAVIGRELLLRQLQDQLLQHLLAHLVGDSIEHETYGVGSVRLITGSGNKSVAHVSFEEHGEKKLLIRLAPIIKITDKD